MGGGGREPADMGRRSELDAGGAEAGARRFSGGWRAAAGLRAAGCSGVMAAGAPALLVGRGILAAAGILASGAAAVSRATVALLGRLLGALGGADLALLLGALGAADLALLLDGGGRVLLPLFLPLLLLLALLLAAAPARAYGAVSVAAAGMVCGAVGRTPTAARSSRGTGRAPVAMRAVSVTTATKERKKERN